MKKTKIENIKNKKKKLVLKGNMVLLLLRKLLYLPDYLFCVYITIVPFVNEILMNSCNRISFLARMGKLSIFCLCLQLCVLLQICTASVTNVKYTVVLDKVKLTLKVLKTNYFSITM